MCRSSECPALLLQSLTAGKKPRHVSPRRWYGPIGQEEDKGFESPEQESSAEAGGAVAGAEDAGRDSAQSMAPAAGTPSGLVRGEPGHPGILTSQGFLSEQQQQPSLRGERTRDERGNPRASACLAPKTLAWVLRAGLAAPALLLREKQTIGGEGNVL